MTSSEPIARAVPSLHIALALPSGAFSARLRAVFEAYARVTHVTSRRALVRALARHRDIGAVLALFGLPDGSPLDIIRRFMLVRRQGLAVVFVPESASHRVINAVAASGALLGMNDEADEHVRKIAKNMLRIHFEDLLERGVPEAWELLFETTRRWQKRFGLSELDEMFLRIRACGMSPFAALGGSSRAEQLEADLLARVDAQSVWDLIDRLHREAFRSAIPGVAHEGASRE